MAIFRPGPLVGSISGNLGAVNFRVTKGSPTIAMRSTKSRIRTAKTMLVAGGVERAAPEWAGLTDAQRQAWSDYARFLNRSNRLGISRSYTGRQAQTAFMLAKSPYWRGSSYVAVPPLYGRTPTPSISSCAWSESGSQTITFDFLGAIYSSLYLFGQHHYQYGPRAAAGCLDYFGNVPLTANPLDVTTTLSNFGIEIYEGEQIRLRTYLIAHDHFPSFNSFHVLTVTA